MPPCTLASYGRRSQPESSRWASVLFDWQGNSIHRSTKQWLYQHWICDGWSSGKCRFWPARGGKFSVKAFSAFVWQKVHLLKGANVAGAAPMLFLFSGLRTFGICVGPHKEIPQLHFPRSPSPVQNLQGCLTFASKWRAAGTKCLLPYFSGCKKGQFSYLCSIFPWSAGLELIRCPSAMDRCH